MESPLANPYSYTAPTPTFLLPTCNSSPVGSLDFSFFLHTKFDQLTLCREDFIKAAMVFTGINLVACVGCWFFITTKKRLAWGLSLMNSLVMSVMGLVYIHQKYEVILDAIVTGTGGEAVLHSVDDVSALVCLWFAIVNVVDILFGALCYTEYLGLFTAILHHPFYVWVMIVATTGKGGFIHMPPFASGFMLASIEEIPTFFLALGSMVPSLRTDLGFGFSFFVLRICYHFCLIYSTIRLNLSLPSTVIPSVGFLMHVYWFWVWVRKYGRLLVRDIPKVP